jgi:hypothetical protein
LERVDSDGICERRIDWLSGIFWHNCSINDRAEFGRREWIAAKY